MPPRAAPTLRRAVRAIRHLSHLGTFAFVALMTHHVYSSSLEGIEERNGVMTSIFTGFTDARPAGRPGPATQATSAVGRAPDAAFATPPPRARDPREGVLVVMDPVNLAASSAELAFDR